MGADGPIQAKGPRHAPAASDWTSHPWLAALVRITAVLTPASVSFAASLWFASRWPRHESGLPLIVWLALLFVGSFSVLLTVDRVARRLLPLAALLKLSLAFPDTAPSRFNLAMRTGTTRQLSRRIEDLQSDGLGDDTTQHAVVLLELVAALSAHDRLTRGHCERVRAYTDLIAQEMNIPSADQELLRWSALIHDVGKLFVPFEVLNKRGKPNDEEWEQLKAHAALGGQLAEPLRPWLGGWVDSVGHHHERWDGNGYPSGLAAGAIPLGARIVAVADAYDVMTSVRSYKKARPADEARAEIAACSGGQFDPDVARAFLNIGIGKLRWAMGPASWLVNIFGPGASVAPAVPSVVASAAVATVVATGVALSSLTGVLGLDDLGHAPDELALVEDTPGEVAVAEPNDSEALDPAPTSDSASTSTSLSPNFSPDLPTFPNASPISQPVGPARSSATSAPNKPAASTTRPATAAPATTASGQASTTATPTTAPATTAPTTTAPATTALTTTTLTTTTTTAPVVEVVLNRTHIEAEASSTLAPDPPLSYSISNTLDSNLSTAWNNNSATAGSGVGEHLYFTFDEPVELLRITLINGYAKTPTLFLQNHRLKDVTIITDAGQLSVRLADTDTFQPVVGNFGSTSYVEIVVNSIYLGTGFEDSNLTSDLALTEIRFIINGA